MKTENAQVVVDGGRTLEYQCSGPEDGLPLVFHHGTPGTLPPRDFARAAHERGLRLVTVKRPGYANSGRRPGRAVVDVVPDTAAVLRALGADRLLLAGWSGGGPHALACAARLPGAIRALIIAGLAPAGADGLDFRAGMDDDNAHEWDAAFQGERDLRTYVDPIAPALLDALTPDLAADLLPAPDAAAMTPEFAADLAAANRDGLRPGIDGWVDDELAFTRPWGFDPAEIALPVSVWHGRRDVNVPYAHGAWVAARIPYASLHPAAGDAHLSILATGTGRMLDHLTART
ncbi:alpha/beta fold hydrolase [Actinoplanes sp. RD1]|uniref:alpha/beta fold hydrolase n=1 Tax=Actinoplanes sp. RD1 TaxID=3064538 RepID=UPI002740B032|nr:alpha/beta hydrolase [Actinoplanes sp. RD1]